MVQTQTSNTKTGFVEAKYDVYLYKYTKNFTEKLRSAPPDGLGLKDIGDLRLTTSEFTKPADRAKAIQDAVKAKVFSGANRFEGLEALKEALLENFVVQRIQQGKIEEDPASNKVGNWLQLYQPDYYKKFKDKVIGAKEVLNKLLKEVIKTETSHPGVFARQIKLTDLDNLDQNAVVAIQ